MSLYVMLYEFASHFALTICKELVVNSTSFISVPFCSQHTNLYPSLVGAWFAFSVSEFSAVSIAGIGFPPFESKARTLPNVFCFNESVLNSLALNFSCAIVVMFGNDCTHSKFSAKPSELIISCSAIVKFRFK